jgi:hypothetical protein
MYLSVELAEQESRGLYVTGGSANPTTIHKSGEEMTQDGWATSLPGNI